MPSQHIRRLLLALVLTQQPRLVLVLQVNRRKVLHIFLGFPKGTAMSAPFGPRRSGIQEVVSVSLEELLRADAHRLDCFLWWLCRTPTSSPMNSPTNLPSRRRRQLRSHELVISNGGGGAGGGLRRGRGGEVGAGGRGG